MWRILLSEFWDDLQAQRTRVLLTCMGIACGTFIVVVLLALGEGIKRGVMTELLGAYDDALIVRPGMTSTPYRGLPARRGIRLEEADLHALVREVPDITAASPVYSTWGLQIGVEGRPRAKEEIQLEGVDATYQSLRKVRAAPGGRFINDRDVAERRRVAFVSDSLARFLFPGTDAVGQAVRIANQPFVVIGIAERKVQTGIQMDGNYATVIIPSSTFRTLRSARYLSHMLLRARDPQDSEPVQDAVRAVLAERHRFDPADPIALWIDDWAADARTASRVLTGIQVFMGMVGGLTLLVAAVGVANIMYVAVKERTQEVGIKLALGARSRHIVAQFVFEAVVLAAAGGLAGLAAAGLAVAVINGLDTDNPALVYLLNPVISWTIAFATVIILMVIGFVAGVFPARRAARLDPVESLRYE